MTTVTVNPRSTHILGLPGELQWIKIDTIQVDMTYQRPISRYQVNKLKREWDSDLLGVILISERDDLGRYVLDGQHRVECLREMGYGDQAVPAMVYHHLSLETEAKIFAMTNKNRLYLSPQYAFRARLLSGDPVALDINEMVQAFGLHINYWKAIPGDEPGMGRPEGMLTCVGELESIYRDFADTSMLTKTLRVAQQAWGSQVVGLSASVMRGIAILIYNFEAVLDWERLQNILTNTTPQRLVAEARDLAASGVPTAITQLLIKKYNYRQGHKSRLPSRALRKSNQRRG